MPEYLQIKFGAVTFPVDSSDVSNDNLFSVFDPARNQMLDLFRTAINTEVAGDTSTILPTSVWDGLVSGTVLAGRLPVADTLYQMPTRAVLRERAITYPVLCLYRTTHTQDEFTLQRERITQEWGLDYILGPLAGEDYQRLAGVMHGVKQILQLVIRRGGHPNFESDAPQFGEGKGELSTIFITGGTEGPADYGEDAEGLEFFGVSLKLRTTEIDGSVDGEATDFDGASITIGVGNQNEIKPAVIEVRTEVPLAEND